ncbi:MAG: hypothetical protein C0624_08095 [Desulfuromonas sp.]|nr:MAG: hypothetical protein C0624_08095 [Desulfuromonas sp.]
MTKRRLTTCLAIIALACAGCSYQAWYEGFREHERRQCYELTSPGEVRQCLDQINSLSYEDYLRAREKNPDAETGRGVQ